MQIKLGSYQLTTVECPPWAERQLVSWQPGVAVSSFYLLLWGISWLSPHQRLQLWIHGNPLPTNMLENSPPKFNREEFYFRYISCQRKCFIFYFVLKVSFSDLGIQVFSIHPWKSDKTGHTGSSYTFAFDVHNGYNKHEFDTQIQPGYAQKLI